MNTLGLRHVALQVQDPQRSKEFYVRVLKMKVEWEPDPDNVYLTSGGQDNLAIHRAQAQPSEDAAQRLDHIGFALPSLEDVDHWHRWALEQGVKILKTVKTHRDGARSFYMADPDGTVIQMIFHPPIAQLQSQA